MHRLLKYLISYFRKEKYSIDPQLQVRDLLSMVSRRLMKILRGIVFYRQVLFVGKAVELLHKRKITIGRSVTLHDFVEINALSTNGVEIGDNVSLGKYGIIRCTAVLNEMGFGLRIGNNVGIGSSFYLGCWGGCEIGSNTIIGERFTVHSDNHEFDGERLVRMNSCIKQPVVIGENCWIGSNVTILGGVKVGDNAVIGAGSIVTKDIDASSVAVGNPAKVIRRLK